MRGCTDERQRQKEGNRKREKSVWVGELEDTEMLYITYCHMFQMRLLLKLDKRAALKNHLHFHNVLIKTNLLYLFGDWKGRVNKKEGEFPLCLL